MSTDLSRERARLYLITPPQISDIPGFVDQFRAAIAGGDIASLQIRIKNQGELDPVATRQVALAVQPLCRANQIALIINDSPHLCLAVEADGIHLGDQDMDIPAARRLIGDDLIIGATCRNSRHVAMLAGEAGADYLAFGAFHPSRTKVDTTPADPGILTWCQMFLTLPCVAIGGVDVTNAKTLVAAGADFIAASSGVWDYADGPAAAVNRFNQVIDQAMAGE
jgi:thiamine-phosphate pyrophosphorylase